MTQSSRPVGEHQNTYAPVGTAHDPGPYSSLQWRECVRIREVVGLYSGSLAAGPYYGYLNNLAVTDDGADITIDTGACHVSGNILENDASVTISPTHPGAPDEYTVVAILNDQDVVYTTALDAPGTADYDGVVNSIPQRSCRLAIFQGSPAALVQTDTVFMVPLATFDISAAGAITNLTQDETIRTWVNAQTKYLLIPAIHAYDLTVTTDIYYTVTVNYGQPAINLAGSHDCYAYGRWRVPEDFISDLVIQGVAFGEATGPDIYCQNTYQSGTCGGSQSTNSEASGLAAEALDTTRTDYSCHATLAVASANIGNIGDMVRLIFERDATNVLDTLGAQSLKFVGFRVQYFGYRR